tara:strand:+ start:2443 stop:2616 length:174 start_codon:yes stop_codon:yes gene_type:complete
MENENEGVFDFLDNLRDDGSINMFGAAPVLQEVFDMTKAEARQVLNEWMKKPKKDFT